MTRKWAGSKKLLDFFFFFFAIPREPTSLRRKIFLPDGLDSSMLDSAPRELSGEGAGWPRKPPCIQVQKHLASDAEDPYQYFTAMAAYFSCLLSLVNSPRMDCTLSSRSSP